MTRNVNVATPPKHVQHIVDEWYVQRFPMGTKGINEVTTYKRYYLMIKISGCITLE